MTTSGDIIAMPASVDRCGAVRMMSVVVVVLRLMMMAPMPTTGVSRTSIG